MALSKVAAAGLLTMVLGAPAAQAAEIVVLSTTAAKEALHDIIPLFERTSGHKINITYGNGPTVVERIKAGATGDLFVGPDEFTDVLIKDGKLVAGSRVDFAHSLTGVAVRAGAPRPDIGTPDTFKSALLAAKTVSYSAGSSGLYILNVFERLGISEQIKAKRVAPQPGELVGAVVARGAAEIGIHQFSEFLPVSGIDVIGPLPGDLQKTIVYGAAVFPMSTQREAGSAFVGFLRSPTAAAIVKKKGMDPV